MNDRENEIHLYYFTGFNQECYVFDNGKWIVIVGKVKVMEPINSEKTPVVT